MKPWQIVAGIAGILGLGLGILLLVAVGLLCFALVVTGLHWASETHPIGLGVGVALVVAFIVGFCVVGSRA